MSDSETSNVAAFVGATGGAGTTRTVVEVASALAADGREVAVLDAAFATQGLADYVDGRIDPDVTALLTDARDADVSAGFVDLDSSSELPGRIAVCPAYAPFERLARAKTTDAAKRLEARIESAAVRFDHVLIDVPPIAANQAVAAVTAAGTVAVVAPATERGTEAIQQSHERLADVGTAASLVVSTRGELATADVAIPETDATGVGAAPSGFGDGEFATAISRVAGAVTGRDIAAPEPAENGFLGSVGDYVSR